MSVTDWTSNFFAMPLGCGVDICGSLETSVHSGFLNEYLNVRPAVLDYVDGVVSDARKTGGFTHLVVTGHSQGGAIATLAALEMGHRYKSQFNVLVTPITFAAP